MSETEENKEYWAWRDKDGAYRHIYRAKFLVEMCSPDGFKKAEERGDGKIVQVNIIEVKGTELTAEKQE